MLHGHAVYKQSDWEFLSEGYLIRHKVVHGGRTDWTTAGFAQLGRKFGVWTPYARFAYLNAPQGDAVYAQLGDSGLHYKAGVGLRWDFCNLAAAKAQYDHNFEKGAQDLNQLSLQVAFTF